MLLLGATAFGLLAPRSELRIRALAAGVILYLAAIAVLFRYQHFHGRLLASALALGGPVLALVYRGGRGAWRSAIDLLLVAACASCLWTSIVHNTRKPLTGFFAVWKPGDRVARMGLGKPHFEAAVRFIDKLPPGRVGFVPASIESFAYPLFGAHLDRPVTIVHASRMRGGVSTAGLPDVDCLLFTGPRQTFLVDGPPLPTPWPWFDGVELSPLLDALRAPGSGWRVAMEAGQGDDTVLLFTRTTWIGRGRIERTKRRAERGAGPG